MFVGVCRLVLHLSGNNSLKGKRRVVSSVVGRTRAKFNASVAEVADNDVLRRAVIGVSVIGNQAAHVDSMLGRIGSFVEWMGLASVTSLETEVIPLGDELESGGRFEPPLDSWLPDEAATDEDWAEEEEW